MDMPLAYRRRPSGGGYEDWEPLDSIEASLDAPHEDLLFCEGRTLEEVQAELEGRFPAADPRLTRLIRMSKGLTAPPSFRVLAESRYDGYSVEEAVELARVLPGNRVRSSFSFRWQRNSLLEQDCLWDEADSCVVYDPQRAQRRRRAKERSASRPKTPQQGFLRGEELLEVARSLVDLLKGEEHLSWPNLHYASPRRWDAVRGLTHALELVWLVYGPTAHRQAAKWPELMKKWRTRGEATRTAFGEDYDRYRSKLWDFLDEESKLRKAPRRQLASRRKEAPW